MDFNDIPLRSYKSPLGFPWDSTLDKKDLFVGKIR